MGNSLKTYILLTPKKWHDELFSHLSEKIPGNWVRITDQKDLSVENLKNIQPDKIFVPHWSFIIPAQLFNEWECIVFHMTDLPYGRGGSPLQNLIERGHKETMISAIRVEKGIDTGPVYLKRELSLDGTAEEIFTRASAVIENMIIEIINTNPVPEKQEGETVVFKRRKPEQGNIQTIESLDKIYDYIRMLDCEGYPPAFIETDYFKIEFTKASYDNTTLNANVRITKK